MANNIKAEVAQSNGNRIASNIDIEQVLNTLLQQCPPPSVNQLKQILDKINAEKAFQKPSLRVEQLQMLGIRVERKMEILKNNQNNKDNNQCPPPIAIAPLTEAFSNYNNNTSTDVQNLINRFEKVVTSLNAQPLKLKKQAAPTIKKLKEVIATLKTKGNRMSAVVMNQLNGALNKINDLSNKLKLPEAAAVFVTTVAGIVYVVAEILKAVPSMPMVKDNIQKENTVASNKNKMTV